MGIRRSMVPFEIDPKFLARGLTLVTVAYLLIVLASCGYSSPNSMNNGPTGAQTANGTVSAVSLTSVLSTSGGTQTATAVTLTVPLGTTSLVFCGDQTSKFASNAAVSVNYTNGTYCATLNSVSPM